MMKNNRDSEDKKITRAVFTVALAAAFTLPLQSCNEDVPIAEPFEAPPSEVTRVPVEELDDNVRESVILGGRLYDNWFSEVDGADIPGVENPMGKFIAGYPLAEPYLTFKDLDKDKQYRCKTCHGFEYTGSEFFPVSIMDTPNKMTLDEFRALMSGGFSLSFGTDVETVHNFGTLGLDDDSIDRLADFVIAGVVNTEDYFYPFSPKGTAIGRGDSARGEVLFKGIAGCSRSTCHGATGRAIDFDSGTGATEVEYVGTIGQDDPAEMLHKIRFGHPGESRITSMPTIYDSGLTTQDAADIMTYTQQLPAE